MEKKRVLGHVKNSRIQITKPMEIDFDLPYKQVNLIIGKNGTGKTLVLKITWMMTSLANYYLMAKQAKMPFDIMAVAQYLVDGTFRDNDVTGEIEYTFESNQEGKLNFVMAAFENGKVISADCFFDEDIISQGQPIYMSSATRLMTAHIAYLKLKNMLGIPKGMPTVPTDMIKLQDMHPLYDIILMEQFHLKIDTQTTPATIKKFQDSMHVFDEKFSCTHVRIDFSKPDILYTDGAGVEKSVLTLGAGHQSLFGMFLFMSY